MFVKRLYFVFFHYSICLKNRYNYWNVDVRFILDKLLFDQVSRWMQVAIILVTVELVDG